MNDSEGGLTEDLQHSVLPGVQVLTIHPSPKYSTQISRRYMSLRFAERSSAPKPSMIEWPSLSVPQKSIHIGKAASAGSRDVCLVTLQFLRGQQAVGTRHNDSSAAVQQAFDPEDGAVAREYAQQRGRRAMTSHRCGHEAQQETASHHLAWGQNEELIEHMHMRRWRQRAPGLALMPLHQPDALRTR